MLRRTWGQRLVVGFNLALIVSSLFSAGLLGYAASRAGSINRIALDRSLTELDEGNPGGRVINILLVGSDSSANLDPDDPIQIGRQGERLGDVIIIVHLDERSGDVALLSLPRDLWVPIAGGEREDRINRAFLVGGAATLIDTIEASFGIPIHHYVNVDFAGFEGLVEAVGSVEVHFDTPARDWNVNAEPEPRSQTGFEVLEAGCHSLGPRDALAYVRSRYYQTQNSDGEWVTDPTSDLGRIRRQQDFLRRLVQKAIDVGARNPLVLSDLIDVAIRNVAIDQELTPGALLALSATYRSFEPAGMQSYTFPAEDGTVGANRVLLPRYAAAAPVVALFGGEPFHSPSTVGVTVVYDPSLAGTEPGGDVPEAVAVVRSGLTEAGFDVAELAQEPVEPGMWLRHGPDGRQAAELVLAALSGAGQPTPLDGSSAPNPAGAAYDEVIGSQLVPGQAAASALVAQQTGELREYVTLEEAPALAGRDVVVAMGAPAAPTTGGAGSGDAPGSEGGATSGDTIAGTIPDPSALFGPTSAADAGSEGAGGVVGAPC
jgi:LCP family protein required for cell wall assembly